MLRAGAQDYDTVQLTTQPNGCQGWAFEVVYIGGRNITDKTTWGSFLDNVKQQMFIFDPCAVPESAAMDNVLDARALCDFPTSQRFHCAFCAQSATQAKECVTVASLSSAGRKLLT